MRLGQKLIQVIDTITVDGFVFRVDMRLRPYGDSGALVLSFDAIERYYEEQGRDWERYAWIRARPCAGDVESGRRLIEDLKPFVFRRYLDFGAIQALREMKGRIDAERSRSAMRNDVKLGPGGIREVEFTAQMHQLIWAGRQPALQCTGVVETLDALARQKLLSQEQARQLGGAYRFLRNVEHRLQAIRDEQTQLLPTSALDRARVATGMGFADYETFVAALDSHRDVVSRAFESLIQADADDGMQRWREPWLGSDVPALAAALASSGFGEVDELTGADAAAVYRAGSTLGRRGGTRPAGRVDPAAARRSGKNATAGAHARAPRAAARSDGAPVCLLCAAARKRIRAAPARRNLRREPLARGRTEPPSGAARRTARSGAAVHDSGHRRAARRHR